MDRAREFLRRNEAPVAAAIIMIAVVAGWLVMPRIMLAVSPAGPVYGLAAALVIALLFILAFFAVFWLRARRQRNRHGSDKSLRSP